MMHDIFGPFSGRHRVLVDVIAKRLNALVVLPDCFDGQGGVKVRYVYPKYVFDFKTNSKNLQSNNSFISTPS